LEAVPLLKVVFLSHLNPQYHQNLHQDFCQERRALTFELSQCLDQHRQGSEILRMSLAFYPLFFVLAMAYRNFFYLEDLDLTLGLLITI
jgi:hypothetical protein